MPFIGPYSRCPFDESHTIIDGRLQKHLVKCSKNYPKDTMLHCFYNATHMLTPEQYMHHLANCPSSGNVQCFQTIIGDAQPVGTVPIEELCKVPTEPICDEDWSGNNATYDPIAASADKNVIRSAVGLSKSKKTQFKLNERERIAKIEKKENNTLVNKSFTKKPVLELPLREPKNAAKGIPFDETSDTDIEHLLVKLKKVDLKKDSTLLPKNVSIKNNSSSGENSEENAANNIPSENSSLSGGMETISKKKLNMTRNDVKSYEKPQETDAKNNSIHQHLNKERKKHINSEISVDEVRKISTGRGFTIAFQKIQRNICPGKTANTSLDHYNDVFGYEEDKDDDNVTSQVK